MRWGHRKVRDRYSIKAKRSRDSAKEWDEMAEVAESKGKAKRAAKYRKYAEQDRNNAVRYQSVANANEVIRKENVRLGKERALRFLKTAVVVSAVAGAAFAGKKITDRYANAKIGAVMLDSSTLFVQGYRR